MSRDTLREQLARDVAEFERRGGIVQHLNPGDSSAWTGSAMFNPMPADDDEPVPFSIKAESE